MSMSGNCMCVIWAALNRLLLTYIDNLGFLLFVIVGSYNVHEWCVSDDFVYGFQYCSWRSSIAYCFMSGSLRMLCVRGWLLWRLFCSIRSSVFTNMVSLTGFWISASPCSEKLPCDEGIGGSKQNVHLYSSRISLLHWRSSLSHAPVRILVSFCICLLCVRMLDSWSIAWFGIAVCTCRSQRVFPRWLLGRRCICLLLQEILCLMQESVDPRWKFSSSRD